MTKKYTSTDIISRQLLHNRPKVYLNMMDDVSIQLDYNPYLHENYCSLQLKPEDEEFSISVPLSLPWETRYFGQPLSQMLFRQDQEKQVSILEGLCNYLSDNTQVSVHDCLIKAIEKDDKRLAYTPPTGLKKMLAYARKEYQEKIENHSFLYVSWSVLKVTSELMRKNIAHNSEELSKQGHKSLSRDLETVEVFYENLSFIGEQRAKRHEELLDTLYDEFRSAKKINKDYIPQQFLERLYFS